MKCRSLILRATLTRPPEQARRFFGGDDRTRTDDPLLAKQVLYQLSYVPVTDLDSTEEREPIRANEAPG